MSKGNPTITLRLDPVHYRALKELAEIYCDSVSAIVRDGIGHILERHKQESNIRSIGVSLCLTGTEERWLHVLCGIEGATSDELATKAVRCYIEAEKQKA